MSLEKDFLKAIQTASTPKTSAYDTAAKVVRVDGSRVWVHIDGGVGETPVERTIDCSTGDTVRVRLSGGQAYIIGNNTAPPTDDAVANIARTTALNADENAKRAKMTAEDAQDLAGVAASAAASAQQSADAAQQSATAAGTAATQAQTKANQAAQAASAAQNSADAAANAASVADGKAVAAGNAAAAAQSSANAAQASADNAGEYASRALGNLTTVQSVAETLTWITQHGTMTLTTDVALDPTHVYFVADAGGDYTVGGVTYAVVTDPKASELGTYYELSIDESLNNYVATHLALTSEGLWLIPDNNGFKVLISVGAQGSAYAAGTHIITGGGVVVASFGTETVIKTTNGTELAHFGYALGTASGGGTAVMPYYTIGQRLENTTVGNWSVAEGYSVEASGCAAHTEGIDTHALQECAHAEGMSTTANGSTAHAEGFETTASANATHAEGTGTTASALGAHAEGGNTTASGRTSHAEGLGTVAGYSNQHVSGKYNDNQSDTLLEIGNGTADDARSNAFEVYGSGKFGTPGLWFSVNASGEPCVTFEDGN